MGLLEKSDLLNRVGQGWTVVRLVCDGRAGAVQIVADEARERVQAAYEQLCAYLRRSGVDRTATPMALADGGLLVVSRGPVGGTGSASFRTHRLRFLKPHLAVLGPSAGQRLSFLAFAVIGAIALVGSFYPPAPWPVLLFTATLGGIFILIGVVGSTGRFGVALMYVDLTTGRVTVGRGRRRRAYPLSGIGGVQVCSYEDIGSEVDYTAYELNLVLRQPPGERINMACHANRESIFRDGRALAEFLGVSFWDHTTIA